MSYPLTTRETAQEQDTAWWRSAVVYQIYPRSFADSNGDGIGDLGGVIEHLPYLADLGVDAIWLSPFYRSPQADAGYDVADYRDIDPLFGSLTDAERLITETHRNGLRIVVDLVPNHTSDEHVWFRAALAAAPGSPERARYIFREGRGEHGELPPNSWRSRFGGSAWERIVEADGTPGQWYLHLFDSKQPDLDWSNAEVHAEFASILRFWLDRGVDGFRVDVTHGLVKAEGLPEWHYEDEPARNADGTERRPPMWDQDGVHEIYRSWRALIDTYPGERILTGEAWVAPSERLARYVRPDEMHQAFNFELLLAGWHAGDIRDAMQASIEAYHEVGAPNTWTLSNHDVIRHTTRLTLERGVKSPEGIGPRDPQPDEELGLRRGRAATALMLGLPGCAYVYQGEELGLPEHTTLPDESRQDPVWFRNNGTKPGRDGCRVPLPWVADAPAFGFGPSALSWLPQPESFARYAADVQAGVKGSTLELYRTLLRVRRELKIGNGTLIWEEGYGDDVVAFRVGSVLVLANLGVEPVPLPAGEVVAASGELVDGRVPTDVAVWINS